LIKLEFSLQIFEKSSDIKLMKIRLLRNRVVRYGRTDRQTDTTKLIVAILQTSLKLI